VKEFLISIVLIAVVILFAASFNLEDFIKAILLCCILYFVIFRLGNQAD
jgi:Ca2+/Na+ antiporter